MEHTQWQELIPFYIAQTLPPDQKRAFEAYLADCEGCQQEIDDWRMIASAVWREADDAARNLPPLSPDVYNRLAYRDRPLANQYSSNPPQRRPDSLAIHPQARRQGSRGISLTLVAGLAVALIFGSLLIGLAFRQANTDPDGTPDAVAINVTGQSVTSLPDVFGGSGASPTPLQDFEILPTPVPLDNEAEAVGSSPAQELPLPPPGSGGGMGGGAESAAASSILQPTAIPPQIVGSPEVAMMLPSGGGPYITLTPTVAGQVVVCMAFNPTGDAFSLYQHPSPASDVVGELLPGQRFNVLTTSIEGWYQVFVPGSGTAWLIPGFAYLEGNCDQAVLPLPTTTITVVPSATLPPPTPTFTPSPSATPVTRTDDDLSGTVVVVSAAYADAYAQASFDSDILDAIARDTRLPVIQERVIDGTRWIQVQLPDNRLAWVWGEAVEFTTNE